MSAQTSTDYQAMHDFIINQLGQHANREDLILEVCARIGIDWPEGAGMVEAVELEYSREVARRQGPLMLVLGGVVLLAGLGLSLWALYYFVFEANFQGASALLEIEPSYVMGSLLVTGVGMIGGSVYGLVRVIGAMVDK